jgi:hypothetical protein
MSGDWTDERLAAAFAARAASTPPATADLTALMSAAFRAAPGRSTFGWPRLAASLVGAAAAVVLVALALAGPLITTRPTGSGPVGSSGAATPAASGGPSTPGDAISDLTTHPISVSQAIAVRDRGIDDRELAMAGYLSPSPIIYCPARFSTPNPTLLECPESFSWLMEGDEQLQTRTGSGVPMGPPTGPALHPSFALVTPPTRPTDGSELAPNASVVLIGHFDDRRARLCRAETEAAIRCVDAFLVDRVALLDGLTQPIDTRLDNTRYDAASQSEVSVDPRSAVTEIDRLVQEEAPSDSILSRQLITGERLASVEPALRGTTFAGADLIWLVTTLHVADDGPVSRTWLIVDGATSSFEVSASGPP